MQLKFYCLKARAAKEKLKFMNERISDWVNAVAVDGADYISQVQVFIFYYYFCLSNKTIVCNIIINTFLFLHKYLKTN